MAPVVDSDFVMSCLKANELGDGILYASLHWGKYIFSKGREVWYVWDEHCWREDDMDRAVSAVEDVAVRYAEEIVAQGALLSQAMSDASESGKDKAARIKSTIEELSNRIKKLRCERGRRNCLAFAHTNSVLPLACRSADFDLKPWKLACANGVINLKTGELEPGDPTDYISKRTNVVFPGIDKVDYSVWETFLTQIFNDDASMVDYIHRLLGYAIMGDRSYDHVFPVLVGRGRNGKSVLVEALFRTLGEYAAPIPAEMLLDNRPTSASGVDPFLLSLKGIRLAVASESGEGRRFGADKVKWMTGGDTMTARGLYDKKPISWVPTHMLMLLTNHAPSAPGTDMAFWERCRLIQFLLSFVARPKDQPLKDYERERDTNLPSVLACNTGIILSWLVKGCLRWAKEGLNPPESVTASTNEYQELENDIGQFIEEACVQGPSYRVKASELYAAYAHWFKITINDKDKFRPSQKTFGTRLMAMDMFTRKRSGGMTYIGVAVSEAYQAIVDAAEVKPWNR